MNKLPQRKARLKLPAGEYAPLRAQALQRDEGRCQFCGSSNNLHVHHQRLSHLCPRDRVCAFSPEKIPHDDIVNLFFASDLVHMNS
jgi:5-methylcytosine-specific restriction endonuclease McrA